MGKKIIIFALIVVSLLFDKKVFPYSTNVHERITEKVIDQNKTNLNNYLTAVGLFNGVDEELKSGNDKKIVKDWIKYGSKKEDFNWSWNNNPLFSHFYNPLTNDSGVGLWPSAYSWANAANNDWSWAETRNYFYQGLTLTTKIQREDALAKAFRGIGHMIHLVEDMAVPAHTRADLHIPIVDGEPYESYTNNNISQLQYTSVPFLYWGVSNSSGAPRQLWDFDSYNGTPYSGEYIGLAEFTNENFFSNDTIFEDFSYPDWPSVVEHNDVDINGRERIYLKKLGYAEGGYSESINHLAAGKWFYKYIPSFLVSLKKSSLKLDEKCHEDYQQKLIPRAVGYSAGLLDYFFRGNIEITLPNNGIYTKTTNPAVGFTSIKLLAKNITSNGDEMTDGSIELVVKYKLASEDPFHSVPVPTAQDFSYIVVPENTVRSIPKNTTVELNFDLTQNPIPLYAVDLYLQVVYKGSLGNETDAVAVGYKDISEPTPIDIFSNTDWICLYNNWYVAGSPEAIAQVDVNQDGIAYGANEYDVYPHDQKNIYVKVSSVSNPQAASSSNYDVKVTYLTRGNLATPLYILSDDYQSTTYQFVYSLYSSWVKIDPNDYWTHANRLHTYYGSTIKNQTEYAEESEFCGGNFPCRVYPGYDEYYPGFYPLRGVDMWWGGGLIYIISPYPSGSECDYGLL